MNDREDFYRELGRLLNESPAPVFDLVPPTPDEVRAALDAVAEHRRLHLGELEVITDNDGFPNGVQVRREETEPIVLHPKDRQRLAAIIDEDSTNSEGNEHDCE